jgi:hypothetical protein
MTQTKSSSAIEAAINVILGAFFAWCITMWLLPMWGHKYSAIESIEITSLYAIVGWCRAYILRRAFNLRTLQCYD